jgi:hypothetical protein
LDGTLAISQPITASQGKPRHLGSPQPTDT